jgi:hypothetical protein
MPPKITKAQCEAKGFDWNEDTQTCTMPRITLIKMTLSRGPGCDGGGRAVTIRKLPMAVRMALLKAGRQKKRPRASR